MVTYKSKRVGALASAGSLQNHLKIPLIAKNEISIIFRVNLAILAPENIPAMRPVGAITHSLAMVKIAFFKVLTVI